MSKASLSSMSLWAQMSEIIVKENTKMKQRWKRNELMRFLKFAQLRCSCHRPAPLVWSPGIASLSNKWPGVRGLMAGGMCSNLPLMSLPGASFAIFWASRICRVRGRSPSSARCRAMDLASRLPLIWFSWVSSLAWALNPVSPLYRISHRPQVTVLGTWSSSCWPCRYDRLLSRNIEHKH